MIFTIQIRAQWLQYVLNVLARCPFAEVAEMMADLQKQIAAQQEAKDKDKE